MEDDRKETREEERVTQRAGGSKDHEPRLKSNTFPVHYFHLTARMRTSRHLKPTLTFQQEREAGTSTDPPRGQRSVGS